MSRIRAPRARLVGAVAVALAIAVATGMVIYLTTSGSESTTPTVRTAPRADLASVTVHRYDYFDTARSGGGAASAATDLPLPPDPRQNYGDLYLPPGPHARDSLPLVVLIHGGGWAARFGARTFDPLARSIAAHGLAVYNIEYRRLGSGGGWPATFTDIAAAVDYVPMLDQQNPEIDASSSTIVGHSAGAQLAVWVGTRGRLEVRQVGSEPRWQPNRIVSLAGPLNMKLAADTGDTRVIRVLGGTPAQVPDRYRTVDPIENIDTTIPILAVHGSRDTVVAPVQSETYVAAVRRAGGHARLDLLPGQNHSALVTPTSSAFGRVVDLIVGVARSVP